MNTQERSDYVDEWLKANRTTLAEGRRPVCPYCGSPDDNKRNLDYPTFTCGTEMGRYGEPTSECYEKRVQKLTAERDELRAFKTCVMDNLIRVLSEGSGHGDVRGVQYYAIDVGHTFYHKDVKESFLAAMKEKQASG